MKALKFDLEVPFWCSFGDFSSLNIKLSYPFPPLTTLFGLIQNALGKPSIHTIENNKDIINQYLEDFSHLKFSICIKESGDKIEDFVNIHKNSRENEEYESILKDYLEEFIENKQYKNYIKGELSYLKKYSFFKFLLFDDFGTDIFDEIISFWENIDEDINMLENDNDLRKRYEKKLNQHLSNYIDNSPNRVELKKELKNLKKFSFFKYLLKTDFGEDVFNKIMEYWTSFFNKPHENYEINKTWLSTQIIRQRLIEPYFSIYILSDLENDEEFSLKNIKKALEDPKRPLYIGESDDVVNILGMSIVNIEENISNNISSVLPDIYSNCELIKIPSHLKFDTENEFYTLCSIPNGDLDQEVECYSYDGENFVFL